ncbi:RNA polymerase sigma factor [Ktedonosporobacter rubrisoli]|uniref:RNA polymerase sigma factor n=1 Tax=Ktedonosporobacter rubrisoli TaxID=2509675 RepID=A0A4P6JLX2_KTERU|nr:RNA polymerase sigma factor [Ktedonosporobacter rubrisoli]QBD76214.1 RNA polymerase sigma factor [Ktedonosporobacter rubrisoli]
MVLASSQNTPEYHSIETKFFGERPRLVGLCARLTGNPDAAEDLAQETLLEAWRNLDKFEQRDEDQAENWSKWLSAIARNVCKRWAREHYNDATHVAILATTDDDDDSLTELLPGTESIEIELEREELACLLDRALGMLPPSVREVLIERYIHESSHNEISERLGLSEDALVQRLYRGKLALRRIISTQFSAEAADFGISTAADSQAQLATRIYCPFCGKGQLVKYYNPADNITGFTCPKCGHICAWLDEIQQLKSFKSLLNRQLLLLGDHCWGAINGSQVLCFKCRQPAQFIVHHSPDVSQLDGPVHYPSTYLSCRHCGYVEINGLPHLTLDTREAHQFWRKHARMQWLPERAIDFAGRPALVSSFRSMVDAAQLDVIIDQATLKVLSIHEC